MKRLNCVVALALFTVGCYDAELDPDLYGVYLCEVDNDCALGSACVDGVCGDPAGRTGPIIEVVSPPQLEVFPAGQVATIPLVIGGRDLELTSTQSDDARAGYLEVVLDGAVVDTVTDGDLRDGITVDDLIAPQEPGMHHISVVARRTDGEAFDGDGAIASIGFWIDDGVEHVGILAPAPASKVPLGDQRPLRIEVASLNFTFANPGFISPDQIGATEFEGYVTLYIDADVPTCLPDCNFDYQAAIMPAGLSRVNRMITDEPVELPQELGTVRIEIVAQTMDNMPYVRSATTGDFVYDIVPIQSVVTVGDTP
jgi:hypothetical protein